MASPAHNSRPGPSNSLTNKESFNQTTYKQNNAAGKMGRRKVNHRAHPFTTHSPKKKQPSASPYQRSTLTQNIETRTRTPVEWLKDTKCSICYETIHCHSLHQRKILLTQCTHLFHTNCLIKRLRDNETCPTYREVQRGKTHDYLLNCGYAYRTNNGEEGVTSDTTSSSYLGADIFHSLSPHPSNDVFFIASSNCPIYGTDYQMLRRPLSNTASTDIAISDDDDGDDDKIDHL